MGKVACGLHALSSKKSTITKVKVRQHVNFMSYLIQHKHCTWNGTHSCT